MILRNRVVPILFTVAIVGIATAQQNKPVGLSLLVQNGMMSPLTFYGNPARFVNEVDLVFTATPQTSDDGIDSLKGLKETAKLDWGGVKLVDEDWRATGSTFKRQRFYRGANWMNGDSGFVLYPSDAQGRRIGTPLRLSAGRDDQAGTGDFFIRRFVARQIADGCRSRGDCTGAQFHSQALVQIRTNRNPAKAVVFPPETASLELEWTSNPGIAYRVPVKHAPLKGAPTAYGFQVNLELPKPSNGNYFMPGESLPIRVAFKDAQGRDFFPNHEMPTYGQFVRNEIPAGLGYYSNRIDSTVFYALKHREANILVAFAGPVEKLRVAKSLLDGRRLLDPQAVTATVANDGYTGVFTGLPNFSVSLGDQKNFDQPVKDVVNLVIPKDAQPGTYIAAVKARRIFGGEALNRAASMTFQVGTVVHTNYSASTGKCEACHNGLTAFSNVLHGVTDRRACFGCHMGLSFEPDNALDYRVHSIHSRSRRVGADAQNCVLCHLAQPSGEARGLLKRAGF